MVIVTALALGTLIGAALGTLGGGGSILAVPIFVYVLGFDPKNAIAMSLAVVGVTSLAGATAHWRAGHVNVRVGVMFGAVAMVGTYAGTRLAAFLDGASQLAIFAVVMLTAAAFMARNRRREAETVAAPSPRFGTTAVIVAEGLLVGMLTGVVGVGGGFLIVPALVLLGLSMCDAVGTSLMIIAANCVVGFYGYLGHVTMAWTSMAIVTAGTLPGIWIGTSLHQMVPQRALRRGFATFLIVVAGFILYQNLGTVLSAFPQRRP
jgi:uncharacterized protein